MVFNILFHTNNIKRRRGVHVPPSSAVFQAFSLFSMGAGEVSSSLAAVRSVR